MDEVFGRSKVSGYETSFGTVQAATIKSQGYTQNVQDPNKINDCNDCKQHIKYRLHLAEPTRKRAAHTGRSRYGGFAEF